MRNSLNVRQEKKKHAELASDFGKPVRADQDTASHGDDEKFCRVEIERPALFVGGYAE